MSSSQSLEEEGEDFTEEEEEEGGEEEEEEEEEESEEEPSFVVKKKIKAEPPLRTELSIDEKNLITLCNQEIIPVDPLNYVLWMRDIQKAMLNIFSKGNLIFTFDISYLKKLDSRICQHMLTQRVGFGITGAIRDHMSDLAINVTMTILSYLNRVIKSDDSNVEIVDQALLRRKMNIWSKRKAMKVTMSPKRIKDFDWNMTNIFYYICRKGEVDDDRYNMDIWNKKCDQSASYEASDTFFRVSEIFFYHGLREIYLSSGAYYLCKPEDLHFPPITQMEKMFLMSDVILATKTQRDNMDKLVSRNIASWLVMESDRDFHAKETGDKDPNDSLLVKEYGRPSELNKWIKFIRTYSGICDYWIDKRTGFYNYVYGDNDEYMNIYEEATIVIFRIAVKKNLNIDLLEEDFIIKQKDILLPLSSNRFYNAKYPKIVKTPMGYCLFDVLTNKFLPYKSFLVCLYTWFMFIKFGVHKINLTHTFVKTKLDILVDNNLVKLKMFIRDNLE